MSKSKPKRWLKQALVRSPILRVADNFRPPAAAVLAYHSIAAEPELTDHILGVSLPRTSFEAHMKILAEQFSPVTISEVAEFAKSGRKLPPRAVALTFDDGFADNYTVALPILARCGIPASFYIMVNAVATGTLPWYCRLRFAFHSTHKPDWSTPENGRVYSLSTPEQRKSAMVGAWEVAAKMTGDVQQNFIAGVEATLEVEPAKGEHGFMMTWDQVLALRKAGHIVGAHTLSHPNVAQVSEGEAKSEIVESKKRLEQQMGEPVEHFSYPHPALNPNWSQRTLEITREAGFRSAVLTTPGPVLAGDEPLALKRVYTVANADDFAWNLHSAFLGRFN